MSGARVYLKLNNRLTYEHEREQKEPEDSIVMVKVEGVNKVERWFNKTTTDFVMLKRFRYR